MLWLLAFVITISAAIFQRLTGPTYPIRGKVSLNNNIISYKLSRSHGGDKDHILNIDVSDKDIQGEVVYRRFKTNDEWTTIRMFHDEGGLVGYLPHQPPAGKLEYLVYLMNKEDRISLSGEQAVIIRFKGDVPAHVLIPHIIIMFAAMLLSTRTGMEALQRNNNPKTMALWTIVLLFVGGIILGPLVQQYAFGAFWTGFPLGDDLTDNKTLIAFFGWLFAFFISQRKINGNWWIVAASLILLIVFLIPHSLMGSELDYSEVEEAWIKLPLFLSAILPPLSWRHPV